MSCIFKGGVIAPFLMNRLYCCVIYERFYLNIYALNYTVKLFMRQIYALIHRRQQRFLIERIDGFCVLLGDVFEAHVLAHHAGIFALCQRVIVAVARARFGLLDAQFLKDRGHRAIDVFGAVVRVKAPNYKRELFDDQLQHGQQKRLALILVCDPSEAGKALATIVRCSVTYTRIARY